MYFGLPLPIGLPYATKKELRVLFSLFSMFEVDIRCQIVRLFVHFSVLNYNLLLIIEEN